MCNGGYGYNMTDGGEGTSGHKHSETTKQYFSNLRKELPSERKGTKSSNNTKNNISLAMRGENNPRSKLIKSDILEIRKMISNGISQREIANMFNIKQGHVSAIKLYKTWKI